MSHIAVVYWSGTGHTEAMAQKVAEGIISAGGEATVLTASEFNVSMMDSYAAVAFGCPSKLNGKKIALFGSYGWGDGEWMRTWEEDCKGYGAILSSDPVICNEDPDADAQNACIELGKTLV